MNGQHPLERRAKLLSARMVAQRDALKSYLSGPGDRPPFTEHLPREEALDWWEQHIGDEFGRELLSAMPPAKVEQLRADLGQRIAERRMAGGMPTPEGVV